MVQNILAHTNVYTRYNLEGKINQCTTLDHNNCRSLYRTRLVIAHLGGTINMSGINWLWFTAFVGLNLFQAGLTSFYPLTKILRALGAE